MKRHELLTRILEDKLVGIIRTNSFNEAIKATEAIIEGGVKIVEVAFTTPKADNVIQKVRDKYEGKDVIIGAGTVLDTETARTAILNGAQFIISPSLNLDVIKLCNRYNKLCIPGVMTLTEITQALENGVELVKIFPASALGMGFIKAVKGPLPQAMMMPTGGVSLDNAIEWLEAGSSAIGVGGSMTKAAKDGDYKQVSETARKFRNKINEFKRSDLEWN